MTLFFIALGAVIIFLVWDTAAPSVHSRPFRALLTGLGCCVLSAVFISLLDVFASMAGLLGIEPSDLRLLREFFALVFASLAGGILSYSYAQRSKGLHEDELNATREELVLTQQLLSECNEACEARKSAGHELSSDDVMNRLFMRKIELSEEITRLESEIVRLKKY